jgi:uncharacterized Zn-finger protein
METRQGKLKRKPGSIYYQYQFRCKECKTCFKKRWFLSRHSRTHMPEKRLKYGVGDCNKFFRTKHHLDSHKRELHAPAPLRFRFTCKVCDKIFKTSSSLFQHTNTDTRERAFSCPICSWTFTRNGILERHLTVHTREKPFKCLEPGCGLWKGIHEKG